jgi:hypothetical protein
MWLSLDITDISVELAIGWSTAAILKDVIVSYQSKTNDSGMMSTSDSYAPSS